MASAGYGSDHITAIDILRTTRSANGLAIGIVLKPFSFEGKRRQDEVGSACKLGLYMPFLTLHSLFYEENRKYKNV